MSYRPSDEQLEELRRETLYSYEAGEPSDQASAWVRVVMTGDGGLVWLIDQLLAERARSDAAEDLLEKSQAECAKRGSLLDIRVKPGVVGRLLTERDNETDRADAAEDRVAVLEGVIAKVREYADPGNSAHVLRDGRRVIEILDEVQG